MLLVKPREQQGRTHCSQLIDLLDKLRSLGLIAPVSLQAACKLVNRKSCNDHWRFSCHAQGTVLLFPFNSSPTVV